MSGAKQVVSPTERKSIRGVQFICSGSMPSGCRKTLKRELIKYSPTHISCSTVARHEFCYTMRAIYELNFYKRATKLTKLSLQYSKYAAALQTSLKTVDLFSDNPSNFYFAYKKGLIGLVGLKI